MHPGPLADVVEIEAEDVVADNHVRITAVDGRVQRPQQLRLGQLIAAQHAFPAVGILQGNRDDPVFGPLRIGKVVAFGAGCLDIQRQAAQFGKLKPFEEGCPAVQQIQMGKVGEKEVGGIACTGAFTGFGGQKIAGGQAVAPAVKAELIAKEILTLQLPHRAGRPAATQQRRITDQNKGLEGLVMKLHLSAGSEEDAHELPDRLDGNDAGALVMAKEQRIMSQGTDRHGRLSKIKK